MSSHGDKKCDKCSKVLKDVGRTCSVCHRHGHQAVASKRAGMAGKMECVFGNKFCTSSAAPECCGKHGTANAEEARRKKCGVDRQGIVQPRVSPAVTRQRSTDRTARGLDRQASVAERVEGARTGTRRDQSDTRGGADVGEARLDAGGRAGGSVAGGTGARKRGEGRRRNAGAAGDQAKEFMNGARDLFMLHGSAVTPASGFHDAHGVNRALLEIGRLWFQHPANSRSQERAECW